MIRGLGRFAKNIYFLKPYLYLASFAFLALLAYFLLSGEADENDVYLIPCLLGFLWTLLLSSMLSIFPHFPDKTNTADKFLTRMKHRFKRGFYFLLVLLFFGVSAGVIFMTVKMMTIWWADY